MKLSQCRHLASACGLVAGVFGAGALGTSVFAQQQPAEPPRPEFRRTIIRDDRPRVKVRLVEEDEQIRDTQRRESDATERKERRVEEFDLRVSPPEEHGYWIGLQFEPLPEALRSQLQLEADQGLVVTELFPDTPAVKAGLAKHDVVVKVDDAAVTDVEMLNKAVQATKGEKELALSIYRSGKQEVIKVMPAKRPGDNTFTLRVAPQPGEEDALMGWLPQGLDPDRPTRIEFYNPGVMIDKDFKFKVNDLPKGLSISISKSGEEPAKITVSRITVSKNSESKDEEKWSVTEKELDKLPAEVREHVERMLRPGPWGARALHARPHMEFTPRGIVTVAPRHVEPGKAAPPAVAVPVSPVPAPATDIHRRLDEVNERLEQLRKALEALAKQHAEEAKQ
jgi:hypothetical protein